MLLQVVGDDVPPGLGPDEDMSGGSDAWVILEDAEGNDGDGVFAVDARHLRSAKFAKDLGVMPGARYMETLQVVFALRELQVPEVDQGIRGMGCGASPATAAAMAVPG